MAHNYRVRVPCCGYADIEVEAQSEEDAHRVALEHVTIKDLVEFDFFHQIIDGNVFRGMINCIETEYLGETSDALD